jgi:hypothetical protein
MGEVWTYDAGKTLLLVTGLGCIVRHQLLGISSRSDGNGKGDAYHS